MPKKYYSDVLVKKKKGKISTFFACIFIFLILAGTIFLSSICSGFLTVGAFKGFDFFSHKSTGHSIFLLIMGESADKDSAIKIASGINTQGGAGYLLYLNKTYFVVGSAYQKRVDADSVLNNLSSTKYTLSIKEITIKPITIPTHLKDNSTTLVNIFDLYHNIFIDLYNYSIALDKSTMSNIQVASLINAKLGDIRANKSIVEKINENNSDDFLNKLVNSLIKIDGVLEGGMLKLLNGSSSSYHIKYTLCEFVDIYKITFDNF